MDRLVLTDYRRMWESACGRNFVMALPISSYRVPGRRSESSTETGIILHPAIEGTFGVAMGVGDNPTWIFSTDVSTESIACLHGKESNWIGWELIGENPEPIILRRDKERMAIAHHLPWSNRTVKYILTVGENRCRTGIT